MKINDYADAINAQIIITRYPNQKERWSAHFEDCETMEGGSLVGSYGDGNSPQEALKRYAAMICGKRIAFAVGKANRREFVVPETLES